MKPEPRKIIHLLTQVPTAQRLASIARGMELLAENVATLDLDYTFLEANKRRRSSAVIGGFAEEEAAKVMVLLDVARAGWRDQAVLGNAARAFTDHLARGIYAWTYEGRPADFAEVEEHVEAMSRSHYLDGPSEVEWVFRNMIVDVRESRLYVDYVLREEGPVWTSPKDLDYYDWSSPSPSPTIVRLVLVLSRMGLLTEPAMQATQQVWAGVNMSRTTHWQEVLELNRRVLRRVDDTWPGHPGWDNRDIGYVLDRWSFPLLSLNPHKMIEVTEAHVETARKASTAARADY